VSYKGIFPSTYLQCVSILVAYMVSFKAHLWSARTKTSPFIHYHSILKQKLHNRDCTGSCRISNVEKVIQSDFIFVI